MNIIWFVERIVCTPLTFSGLEIVWRRSARKLKTVATGCAKFNSYES